MKRHILWFVALALLTVSRVSAEGGSVPVRIWAKGTAGSTQQSQWYYTYRYETSYRGYVFTTDTGVWTFTRMVTISGYPYSEYYGRVTTSTTVTGATVQMGGVFLPSSPTIDDGGVSSNTVIAPSQQFTLPIGPNGLVRAEVGRTHTLNITASNVLNGTINVAAPPQYRVLLNGMVRNSCPIATTVTVTLQPRGEPPAGAAGFASTNLGGRVDWRIALGSLHNGDDAGSLRLVDSGLSASWGPLLQSSALQCDSPSAEVFVLRQYNAIRQVIANQVAIDVQQGWNSYVIRCFNPNQMSGLPLPCNFSGQPFVTYTVEKGTLPNSLKITKDTGVRREVLRIERQGVWPNFTWNNSDWTLENQSAVVTTAVQSAGTYQADGTISPRTEALTLTAGAGGATALALSRTHNFLSFGEALVSETVGTTNPVTSTFNYYSDPNQPGSLGHIRSVAVNDGRWEAYEYYDAALADSYQGGKIKYKFKPYVTAPTTENLNPALGEVTYYEYALDPFGFATRPSLVRTTVNGVETAKTSTSYTFSQSIAYAYVATQTEYTSPTTTLTTVREFYSESAPDPFLRTKTISIQQPDGAKQSYLYQWGTWADGTFTRGTTPANPSTATSASARTVVIRGLNPNYGGPCIGTYEEAPVSTIGVVDGKSTAEITIRDTRALVVRTELRIWKNSEWQLATYTDYTYNNAGLLTNRTSSNGTVYTAAYDGLLKTSETDEQGITTSYAYDNAGRVLTRTRQGSGAIGTLVTRYSYDAAGHVTEEQVGWGQTEKIVTASLYDDAGRITRETPPGGYGAVAHTYNVATRTHTATRADGSQVIDEKHIDGRAKAKRGSGVVGEYYSYGVATYSSGPRSLAGASWQQVNLGIDPASGSSPRWRKTWTDWKGREICSVRPGFTGQVDSVEESFYDELTGTEAYSSPGHLLKKTKTGYGDTLYEYNGFGELTRSGLRVSGNGRLSLASNDRITDTNTYYAGVGDFSLYTETTTYPIAGSATPIMTTAVDKKLNGLSGTRVSEIRTVDAERNVTIETIDINRSTATQTKTTARAGISGSVIAATSTEVSVNGLPVSVTGFDGLTTTMQYDSLLRKWRVEDSRGTPKNTTTLAYVQGTNLVQTTTDAGGFVSATGYDAMGRVAWSRDQQNHFSYSSYNSRGQLWRQWGDGTMPVEYEYDASYGEKTRMKTFRAGTNWDANLWPTSPGTADLTRWDYDAPSGLLTAKYDAANLTAAGDPIANAKKVQYTYNLRGQTATRTWARGVVVTLGYDAVTGELLSQTYSDGTPSVTFQYTRSGAPDTVVDATSANATDKRDFQYDPAKPWRLSAEVHSTFYGNRALTRLYDTTQAYFGRVRGFQLGSAPGSNSELEQTYEYQSNGRFERLTSSRLANSGTSRTFVYTYLPDSALLQSLSIAGGHPFTITRAYDPQRDFVTSIEAKWSTATRTKYAYTYDERGFRSSVVQSGDVYADYGDVTSQQFAYDGRGQLTNAITYMGSDISNAEKQLPGRRHEYDYDTAGNRKSSNRTGVAALRDDYTTNPLNQYTARENNTVPASGTAEADATVAVSGGSLAPVAAGRQGRYWNDEIAVNNHLVAGRPWRGSLTITAAKRGTTDKFASDQRLSFIAPVSQSFSYDDDGNLLNDAVWTYEWDAENRLRAMTPTAEALLAGMPNQRLEFKYDYQHRRVERSWWVPNGSTWTLDTLKPRQRYLYDGWSLIAEYEMSGSTPVLKRSYTWGLDIARSLLDAGGVGALLQIADHTTTKTFLPSYDGNGNIAALFDADSSQNGACVAAYEYSPYGEFLHCEGAYAKENPFRFSTKFTDDDTGLVYYGRRYYSACQGRFLGRDPIEENGGLNIYGFVLNNPMNRWDYLGMDPVYEYGLDYSSGTAVGVKFEVHQAGSIYDFVYRGVNNIDWENMSEGDTRYLGRLQTEEGVASAYDFNLGWKAAHDADLRDPLPEAARGQTMTESDAQQLVGTQANIRGGDTITVNTETGELMGMNGFTARAGSVSFGAPVLVRDGAWAESTATGAAANTVTAADIRVTQALPQAPRSGGSSDWAAVHARLVDNAGTMRTGALFAGTIQQAAAVAIGGGGAVLVRVGTTAVRVGQTMTAAGRIVVGEIVVAAGSPAGQRFLDRATNFLDGAFGGQGTSSGYSRSGWAGQAYGQAHDSVVQVLTPPQPTPPPPPNARTRR